MRLAFALLFLLVLIAGCDQKRPIVNVTAPVIHDTTVVVVPPPHHRHHHR